jgi:monovalent cation/proton antiporter MnhG/PhaG subunit
MRAVLEQFFLWVGVALLFLSSVGVHVMKGVFRRLHYTSIANSLASCLIALAAILHPGTPVIRMKAMLTAAFLFYSGSLVQHATARAAWICTRSLVALEDQRPEGDS